MAAGNYHVDLENNPELKAIEDERDTKRETDAGEWDGRITESDGYFDGLIENSKKNAEDQKALVEEQTDFAIDQINQQKDQAEKNYVKEQSGAYVDWQKQINEYGVNAERRASMGMTGTGYSESSKVSMYNAYQNHVAVARQSFDNAVLNYNNAIREAQLQSDSKLAEIAYNALQAEIEFTIQKLQYRNDLIFKKAESQRAIENEYFNKLNSGVIDKGTSDDNLVNDNNNEENFAYVKEKAELVIANSGSNEELLAWLYEQVDNGFISEPQLHELYNKYHKLEYSTWRAGDDGGWYIGAINDNATVINENGDEYSLAGLIDALIDEGMSKKDARSHVKDIQDDLWG